MQTIVLGSPASKESLDELVERAEFGDIEIVDTEGRVRARLSAVEPWQAKLAAQVQGELSANPAEIEELKRRAANPGPKISYQEVKRRLESLAQQSCDTQ